MGSNIHNIKNGFNMRSIYTFEQQTIRLCLDVDQHITTIVSASLLQSIFKIKLHSSASGLSYFRPYSCAVHPISPPLRWRNQLWVVLV